MNKTILFSTKIKEFFRRTFNKRQLITKSIILVSTLVIVLIMSLSFYFWLRDKKLGTEISKNNFWYIKIVHNDGLGFGGLKNNLPAIYTVQSIMFILLFLIFIFSCHNILTSIFISFAMFGGLFNMLQRVNDHGWVLDYFQFGFWEDFPTFNWPDIFVVISIFSSSIVTIIICIKQFFIEKKISQSSSPVTPSNNVDKPKTIIDY